MKSNDNKNGSFVIAKKIKKIEENGNPDSTFIKENYPNDLGKMYTASEIYSKFSNKKDDPRMSLLKIMNCLEECFVNIDKKLDDSFNKDTSYKKAQENKLKMAVAEAYEKVGRLMEEIGILKILIQRTNQNFEDVNLGEIKLSDKQAIKEFDYKENIKYNEVMVVFLKLAHAMNKIAKFVEHFVYGDMLEQDRKKAKLQSDTRIKFMSKQKTDLLKTIADNIQSDDNSNKYQDEYEKLFGDVFENLNFDNDFYIISNLLEIRNSAYFMKSYFSLIGVSYLLKFQDKGKISKDINKWGIIKDTSNNSYILGVDIRGYLASLTFHLPEDDINELKKEFKLPLVKTKFPADYKGIRKDNGEIFSANVLFQVDENQRKYIESKKREYPGNKLYSSMYSQCFNVKSELPKKYIDLEEM